MDPESMSWKNRKFLKNGINLKNQKDRKFLKKWIKSKKKE